VASALCFSLLLIVREGLATDSVTEQEPELEPLVLTASRIQTQRSRTAQAVTVIEPTEADRRSGRHVYDLLRSAPGVNVLNTGGPGQSTTVQIRGANSEQTLVLLDGVPLNDPTNPGRGFDFSQLTAHEIERIEVLRGAQSGVYGNNSNGGVIQIITRRPGAGQRSSVRLDYGAFNTKRGAVTVAGSSGKTRASASALYEDSDGFPAASAGYGNTLSNGYQRVTGNLAVDQDLSDNVQLQITARGNRAKVELPNGGGPPAIGSGEDPNYTGLDSQGAVSARVSHSGLGAWKPSAGVALNLVYRRYDNLADSVNTTPSQSYFRGNRIKFEQSNQLRLSDSSTLLAGLDSQIETIRTFEDYGFGSSEIAGKTQSISGVFSEYRWDSGPVFVTAALRGDRFHGRSDQLTYRVGPGYHLGEKILVKASLGRGFKIPSLYQLYAPSYGEVGLRSEKSLSWDAGVDYGVQSLFGKTHFGVQYFQTEFEDLIDFNNSFRYQNIRKASSRGVEFEAQQEFVGGLKANLTYTYQLARNDETRLRLARRPMHQIVSRVYGAPLRAILPGFDLGMSLRYTGIRNDVSPVSPYGSIVMPSYMVVNTDASYRFGGGVQVFARLDNLLDRRYEEIAGYGTARRSLYLGIQKEL
jgi:vitamin B12 transporter